jgi:hypothetical protein
MSKFSKKFISTSPFKQQDPPGQNQRNILSDIEYNADEFLGFPEERARQRTDEYLGIKPDKDGLREEQNSFEYGDTARHYMGGDQLSRSIQDKIKFLPYPTRAAIGVIGSNIGGLVHEAQNIKEGRPVLESVEDATNNFVGSLGSLFSKNTSTKILDRLKKYLPDGKVKD